MTIAGREIVRKRVSGVYHCISRCVRRVFLCGKDEYTGRFFEHRWTWMKAWSKDRIFMEIESRET